MADHIRLLGDEVEASKWVGYARSRTSGSLTSPIPGVTVRVNQLSGMRQILIRAETGGILFVYGIKNYEWNFIHWAELNPDGKVINEGRSKITVYNDALAWGSYRGKRWGADFYYPDTTYDIVKNGTSVLSGGASVLGIDGKGIYISSHLNDYLWYRDASGLLNDLYFVGPQISSGSSILPLAVGSIADKTYILGFWTGPSQDNYNPGVFLATSAIPNPVPQQLLYRVPLPISPADGLPAYAMGSGPEFFAVYSLPDPAFLRLYDYATGKILAEWLDPTHIVPSWTYINVAVASKYIAIMLVPYLPNGLRSEAMRLYIWKYSKKKGTIILVSKTDISNIMSPYFLMFDMKAAYKGVV